MNELDSITDAIQAEFEARNEAREQTLSLSRKLVRQCANAIRAVHRGEWDTAEKGLKTVRQTASQMIGSAEAYPDIFFSGYTQDALKEMVEAFAVYAIRRNEPLPTPDELNVPGSVYLNGMAEAASEMRRAILDIIRQGESEKAEGLLSQMDEIYEALMGFDFPDAITGGLRRRVDQLRGVLERTRGDLTNSLSQERLHRALVDMRTQLDLAEDGEK